MAEEKESRVWRAVKWLVDALMKTVLFSAVGFWVAYAVHEPFRASVWRLVYAVGPLVVGAMALVGLVSLVYVVRRYWRRLSVAAWRTRMALRLAGRRCCAWLVWRLVVRPARDYFGVVALPERAARELLHMDRATAEEVVIARLRGLSVPALLALESAMASCGPGGRALLLAYPLLLGHESHAMQRMIRACEKLEESGLLMDSTAVPAGGGVLVWLNPLVVKTRGGTRVGDAIQAEVRRRALGDGEVVPH